MYTPDEKRYERMKYRRTGKSGLLLPMVSLGMWHNFGSGDSFENMRRLCRTAFDNGITHFDLANNYGPVYGSAEENMGRILKKDFNGFRDELIISTKAGYDMWPGPYGDHGSRKYLIASIDQSLRRLQLDYVDIFYHHRMDPDTPLMETALALSQIVTSGKALYIGISNYDGKTMREMSALLTGLRVPFIINQNRYSIFDRTIENNGLKTAAREEGKGIIAFSPLAQGLLTDKYLSGIPQDSRIRRDGRFLKESDITPQKLEVIKKLNEMAKNRGESLAQMALSWVLKDDEVTSVLIGASRPEQIEDNVKIVNSQPFETQAALMIEKYINSLNGQKGTPHED